MKTFLKKYWFLFVWVALLLTIGLLIGGVLRVGASFHQATLTSITVTATPEPRRTVTQAATLEPTPTLEPILTDAIPTPVYYSCRDTASGSCVRKDTPAIKAIAMTIFGEGGSVNLQLAVDMLQVLDNTMLNEWDCWNDTCPIRVNPEYRQYTDTTQDERERLALYVLSRPYKTDSGRIYPAWNVWAVPFPWMAVEEIPYSHKLWEQVYGAVLRWMNNPSSGISANWGSQIIVPAKVLTSNSDITYFYGGPGKLDKHLAATASYVYRFDIGEAEYHIYYSTGGHSR